MGFDRAQADYIFNVASNKDPVSDLLQTQFGVPECVMNLSNDVLGLLPSSPLQQVNKSIEEGKQRAQDAIKEIKRKIYRELGILEAGTDGGVVGVFSQINDAIFGQGGLNLLTGLEALGFMFGAATAVWGDVVAPILDKVDEVSLCLDQLKAQESLKTPNAVLAKDYISEDLSGVDAANLENYSLDLDKKYASERKTIIDTLAFISKAQRQQNAINDILDRRFSNPGMFPEPCFAGDLYLEDASATVKMLTSGTDFCVVDATSTGYCSLGPDFADKQSCEEVGGVWTQLDPALLPQQTFSVKPERLDPPISKKGKFILTETGIYYDTVAGGLDIPDNIEELVECSSVIPEKPLQWMFKYDPNCGGKGESVSLKQFNAWANTIFDQDAPGAIDEEPSVQQYYKKDRTLQQIIGERNRHVYDLSSYITDLITSGYANDSALVLNQRQQIQSTNSLYETKAKKRKKQIQIALLFGNFGYGEIPVNDFSFLEESNIDISVGKQEKLVFMPGEVSSIVLPVSTTYSISKEKTLNTVYLDHLLIPSIGRGSLISAASAVDATDHPSVLSLTDNITTKDLIACYNFLGGYVEYDPGSRVFEVVNTADTNNNRYNAQIVASSFDTVFPSGVGLVQFKGVCNFFSGVSGHGNPKAYAYDLPRGDRQTSSQYLQSPYRPMSYMRLPDGVDDFESLLYRNTGFTFETWVHMPGWASGTGGTGPDGWDDSNNASSLHRIILGNENRGGFYYKDDVEILSPNRSSESVFGLLMGFTRDRRFTKNAAPSNLIADNPADEDLKFYMAPTQAVNSSSVTFIRKPGPDECVSGHLSVGQRYLGITVDTSSYDISASFGDGYERLNDCSTVFKLVTVTADPKDNGLVTIYCNGKILKSQNYIETFGFKGSPNIPSPMDPSSFVYSNVFSEELSPVPMNAIASAVYQKDFWYFNGPTAGGYTPWIIGGGYTDGMTNIDLPFDYPESSDEGMNFLGTTYGGRRSGLNGILGSIKLYKRALEESEVIKNYNAQKGFFENIET